MKIGILFPDLPLRTGWIFPREGEDVPLTDYHDDLVTQLQIESLMAATPWEILSTNSGSAISLHTDVGGRLGLFLGDYCQFETKHRMALWEGTHKFPIPRPKIAKSAWLADFNKKRGSRRRHAGADWKKILVIFILTMQDGWCDLDLLLDPFFLHDKVIWFPGASPRLAKTLDLRHKLPREHTDGYSRLGKFSRSRIIGGQLVSGHCWKLDRAISQILLIPSHHNGARARISRWLGISP
ncbi:hypothetical protein PI124_g14692 [Phytophthora idaei]|nr:hypothetical protein PI125_g14446 [Phytophthora idaei]KAG3141016.1 hypothetical protein PI126_g15700 [Phytophthora idaei]KAG3240420.1 hypothetical protein PI124_g14692 [Phytophthora idaei]